MRSFAVQATPRPPSARAGAGFNMGAVRVSGCKDEQDFAGQPFS
ncbi:MAG TPA: hypothetical protein VHP38_00810 [Ruminiclostridium sp.]|nr:hypothetical protein [Ruminiclostridium sp.]